MTTIKATKLIPINSKNIKKKHGCLSSYIQMEGKESKYKLNKAVMKTPIFPHVEGRK